MVADAVVSRNNKERLGLDCNNLCPPNQPLFIQLGLHFRTPEIIEELLCQT